MSRDTLRVGPLSVINQDFAEATEEPGAGPAFWRMDGIFGLGFAAAAVNLAVPPFYNMVQQGLVEPIFSFYFGDRRRTGDVSEVVFGGVNHDRFSGKLITLPTRNKPTWETTFTSLAFGNWSVDLNNTGAAIDTGASFTLLPTDLADQMYALPSLTSSSRTNLTPGWQPSTHGCKARWSGRIPNRVLESR
jgi:saccharopepsin